MARYKFKIFIKLLTGLIGILGIGCSTTVETHNAKIVGQIGATADSFAKKSMKYSNIRNHIYTLAFNDTANNSKNPDNPFSLQLDALNTSNTAIKQFFGLADGLMYFF